MPPTTAKRAPSEHRLLGACLAFFLICALAGAADRVSLVLDTTVELPGAGLKIRPPKDFALRAMPVVSAVTYENRNTGEKLEAYEPLALWKQEQHEARFVGEEGVLTLATVRYEPLPAMRLINRQHATQESYRKTLEAHRDGDWDNDDYTAWIEAYTGWTVADISATVRNADIDYTYRFYRFNEIPANRGVAWLVRLPEGDGWRYIAVIFEFDPRYEVRNMAALVINCVESLAPGERNTGNQAPDRRFQSNRGDAASGRGEEFQRTRERVIANIRNLENWWFVETDSYIICSDMDRSSHRLVDAIQEEIEIMREAYQRFLPPVRPIEEVSVVRVFAEREAYLDYVPKNMEWSGGAWIPPKKELVISPLEINSRKQERQIMLRVVYHEAFHQYAHYALDQRQLPTWFDEGHAAFFETAEVDARRRTLEIRENERWTEILDALIEQRQLNLEAVIRMTPEQFYGPGREFHYAQAWALVYFMHKAAPLLDDRRYHRALLPVVETVQDRKSAQEASQAFLKKVDMDRIQSDFIDFWNSRTARRKADRLELFKD